MADIVLSNISKRFGRTRAVDDLTMSVASGAFLALLGPSGCGKTTVLRLIAGLDRPDAGSLRIGGRVMVDGRAFVEPEDRGLGMVFQSYALWPHMSVAGNVEFGLAVRRLGAAERRERVGEALELVGLSALADRRPHELSGGQRQRVALARSLAVRPPLILLDEPLANLDAHLRQTMQGEFRRIHRQAGTTFVFVTHDQGEALALADHVAVMDAGRLQQLAAPEDLYRRPATPMVAGFIGGGRTVPVEVLPAPAGDGMRTIRLQGRTFRVPGEAAPGPGWLCLRPDDLALCGVAAGERQGERLRAHVVDQRFEGGGYLVALRLEGLGEAGLAEVRSKAPATPGAPVDVAIVDGWVLGRAAAGREAGA